MADNRKNKPKKPGKDDLLNGVEEAFGVITDKIDKVSAWQKRQIFGKKQTGPIRYASFNDRVFASVIDTAISFILLGPLLMGMSDLIYGNSRENPMIGISPDMPTQQMLAHLAETRFFSNLLLDYTIHFIVFGIIILWLWNKSSATPGKWALKMRIVDAETFTKPTQKQFFIRYLGYMVSVLPLTAGFFWIMLDKKKRGWHDMIANTVVIKVDHWRFKDDGTVPHIILPEEDNEQEQEADKEATKQ